MYPGWTPNWAVLESEARGEKNGGWGRWAEAGAVGRGQGKGQGHAGRSYGKSRTVDRGKVGSASQGWEKTKRAS